MLELTLYRRAIDGTDYEENHVKDVIEGKDRFWDNLIEKEDRETAEYLYMIDDLKHLQQSHDEEQSGSIFTQEFAN